MLTDSKLFTVLMGIASAVKGVVFVCDELRYGISMATNTNEKTQGVPELSLHLVAKLERSGSCVVS